VTAAGRTDARSDATSDATTDARGDGRTAVVTGAARGIGAACVDHLVAAGWRVVAVDAPDGTEVDGVPQPLASEHDLHELVARHDGAVRAHPADVRDLAALEDAVAGALAWTGRLDAAVAGAAVIGGGTPLWEADDALYDAVMDVDVRGVWHLARAAVPALLAADVPDGRFVAVSSAAGTSGLYGLGLYGAAKHAVVGLVRGLAADLAGRGVTAVAVAPGSTRTPMLEATRALYGLDDVESFAAHQGLRRLLEPGEVGGLVAWLCEPATAAINGGVVAADGGMGL
jgi:SDR family mycofactocin-dependent oxidoreductase